MPMSVLTIMSRSIRPLRIPSRSGTLPWECVAAALFARDEGVLSHHDGAEVLEADRSLMHGYIVERAEFVYHAGHGDGAHEGDRACRACQAGACRAARRSAGL